MSASRFRFFVVLWIVAYGWRFSLPLSSYRQPDYVVGASFLLLFVGVVSAVGLLFFQRIARGAFVVFTIATIAFNPFVGARVVPPFNGMLAFITVLLHGAILALAFSAPINALFRIIDEEIEDEEPRTESEPEDDFVELYETSNDEAVPVIASLLTDAGIDFLTTKSDPVRFLVHEGDLPRARNVIQEEIVN